MFDWILNTPLLHVEQTQTRFWTVNYKTFIITLSCLIVSGSNKMHQEENYQDFLK